MTEHLTEDQIRELLADYAHLVDSLCSVFHIRIDFYDDDDTEPTWGYHFHEGQTGEICQFETTSVTGFDTPVDAMMAAITTRLTSRDTTPSRVSLCA
jgi:hypothetical protein